MLNNIHSEFHECSKNEFACYLSCPVDKVIKSCYNKIYSIVQSPPCCGSGGGRGGCCLLVSGEDYGRKKRPSWAERQERKGTWRY